MTYFPSSANSIPASALPAAGTLTGPEILVVTQGGVDVQTTLTAVGTLLGAATPAVPGAPGVPVKGSTTTSSIVLSWAAPGTGGTATSYVLQQSPTGTATWTTIATTSALSATATGLAAATGYDFRVAGINAGGTGAYSAVLSNAQTFASLTAPNAVTGLAASAITSSGLTLSWVESGGAPSTRSVTQRTPSGSGSYVASTGSFGSTGGAVTGLAASSSYDFQVVESNAAGSSPAATLSNVATAAATPGAVTNLAAGAIGATTVALTWTNAATATGWTVLQRTPSGSGSFVAATLSVAATASGATVSGLTTGNVYDFEVVTSNSFGTSSQVAVLAGITPAVGASLPGQVTNVVLGTPTSTSMPMTWTAPASGGAPTGFKVELSTDGGSTFGTPITVGTWDTYYVATGLTASTSTIARVTATNGSGNGTVSANSAAVSTLASGANSVALTAPATATAGTDFTVTYTTNVTGAGLTITLGGTEWDASGARQYVGLSTSGGSLPTINVPVAGTYTVRIYSGSTLLAESRPIVVTGNLASQTYSVTAGGIAYTITTTPAIPATLARNKELYISLQIRNASTSALDTSAGYFAWDTASSGSPSSAAQFANSSGMIRLHFDSSSFAASTRYLWLQTATTGFNWFVVGPSGTAVP